MEEFKFKEYKKLVVDITYKLVSLVDKIEKLERMKQKFIENGETLTNNQQIKINKYEDISEECLKHIKNLY